MAQRLSLASIWFSNIDLHTRGRATSVGGTSTVQEATKQIQKLKVWQKDGVEGLFLNRNMGKPQTIDAHAAIRRKKG